MNLTRLALQNSRVTIVLLAIIAALGVNEYINMSRDSMPPYTLRKAEIISKLPGAGMERVESIITDKLEEAIKEIPEVKNIESESRSEISVITVELKNEVRKKQLAEVWNKLRRKIEAAKSELPSEIIGPMIKDEEIGAGYGIILALKSEGASYNIMEKYARDIRYELIRLPDIAKVLLEGIQKERSFIESVVKVNQAKSISLSIAPKDGSNIVQLGKEIDRKIQKINSSLPLGLDLVRVLSEDHEVDEQISGFLKTLAQSVLIALAVTIMFLGFRAGSIVAAMVFATMLAALFFMGILETGLNKVSLAALIMSLGILVNNGTVMTESIQVRSEDGESIFDACVNSCKLLMLPMLISSLVASAAFFSFFLAETTMGELSAPIFPVITISLLCSWMLTFTFVPLLAMVLVKAKTPRETEDEEKLPYMERLNLWYNALLLRVLQKPSPFIFFIASLFLLSLWGLSALPLKLLPSNDNNLVAIDVGFSGETRIEIIEAAVEKIENYINKSLSVNDKKTRGVINYSLYIGASPKYYDRGYFQKKPDSGYAHMTLNTSGYLDNDYIIEKLDKYCLDNFPDADIRVNRLARAGATQTPVEIRLFGKNLDKLSEIAETIKTRLINTPGVKNISDNREPKIKRKNLKRTINIGAYLKPGYTAGDILKSIKPWLDKRQKTWKPGYTCELGGEYENINENMGAIFKYLPGSLLIIIILLFVQFNSFRKTIIIIATIPLGFTGVVFGWMAMNSFVSFFGVLGFIALAGILIHSSITLLDRVDAEREINPGLSPQEALLEAANHNFRPALTTIFSVSLGMLPLYFGGGFLWEPPVIAIISGLLFATSLILLFVPALYKVLFRIDFDDFEFNPDYYEV